MSRSVDGDRYPSNSHEKDAATSTEVENASDGYPAGQKDVEELHRDYSGVVKKTDQKEIALVRKLDMYIMPILWVMLWLNYLDRNAITSARLNNLEEDLGLVGTQYNTCISVLFAGYLVMQLPSNMILTRVRPSIYLSCCMMAWATVSACTALATNFTHMVVLRFLLGFTEAPYYVGALYLLSCFYTRKELATRVSILYMGNLLATAFAGLIASGIFNGLDGAHGLKGWQWLFIIEGAITFFVASLGLFLLPDKPSTTRWLTEDERVLAYERIERDTVSDKTGESSVMRGLKEASLDPRTWIFALMQNFHLSAAGFNNFFPTLVGTLGFGRDVTLALTCPPYVFSAALCLLAGYTSDRFNERTWHITGGMLLAILGFVISAATLNVPARYVATFMYATGAYTVNSMILSWVGTTLAQTKEKKASAYAIVNVCANASYIYTAYLWPESDDPRYVTGFSTNAAFAFGCISCAWVMKVILRRKNQKIRQSTDERTMLYSY